VAAALAAAPAAAFAQEPPKPADELAAARAQLQKTLASVRQFEVSMLVEPSFVFRP
jgi:hypothetical protein